MIGVLRDITAALSALSRLGKSQLILVFAGTAVTVVLSGFCTAWSGSAFHAIIAFLLCDIINAIYSVTYENSYAFSSLAWLLVEQNAVLTVSSGLGILDQTPSWAMPHALPWLTVGFGWAILVILLALQLSLRREWGWHAHKLGLARAEDVALYQRILQLEGAVMLDFCQLIPCAVVIIGKYAFSDDDASGGIARNSTSTTAAPPSFLTSVPEATGTSRANTTTTTTTSSSSSSTTAAMMMSTTQAAGLPSANSNDGLGPTISILYLAAAIISAICAPLLATAARRENSTVFLSACALTVLATAAITFATTDTLRREYPLHGSDIVRVTLVIATCISRLLLLIAIMRTNALFGSGIGHRIRRSNEAALSAFEAWGNDPDGTISVGGSNLRRSGFGAASTVSGGGGGGRHHYHHHHHRYHPQDLEGSNILHNASGPLDDGFSDTGSDVGAGNSAAMFYSNEHVSSSSASAVQTGGYTAYNGSHQQQQHHHNNNRASSSSSSAVSRQQQQQQQQQQQHYMGAAAGVNLMTAAAGSGGGGCGIRGGETTASALLPAPSVDSNLASINRSRDPSVAVVGPSSSSSSSALLLGGGGGGGVGAPPGSVGRLASLRNDSGNVESNSMHTLRDTNNNNNQNQGSASSAGPHAVAARASSLAGDDTSSLVSDGQLSQSQQLHQQGSSSASAPRTISFVRANRGRMPVSPNNATATRSQKGGGAGHNSNSSDFPKR